jgi:hypothetical protein
MVYHRVHLLDVVLVCTGCLKMWFLTVARRFCVVFWCTIVMTKKNHENSLSAYPIARRDSTLTPHAGHSSKCASSGGKYSHHMEVLDPLWCKWREHFLLYMSKENCVWHVACGTVLVRR